MKFFLAAIGLAFALSSLVQAGAPDGRGVELLAETAATGPTIYLSDLLPADAPSALRAQGDTIVLGASPKCGSARELRRADIEGKLSPPLAARITVPERVMVRC